MSAHETDPTEPTEPTMVEVLESYADAGYDSDFSVTDDGDVLCHSCSTTNPPDLFPAHSLRRLEGESDPADSAALVATECPSCGAQGVLVLRYGPEAPIEHGDVVRALRDERREGELAGDQTPGEAAVTDP